MAPRLVGSNHGEPLAVVRGDPVGRSAPALHLAGDEPDHPVRGDGDAADVHRIAVARRHEDRRALECGHERVHRLPALHPILELLAEPDRSRRGEPAHPEPAVRAERQAEPVAERDQVPRVVARAGSADARHRVHVVRVPLPLVPGVEGIDVEVRRRVVLRGDDPGDPVVRADVEVPRVLEVVVDHAGDGPRLVIVPVVRVAQVVPVDLQRPVGLQENLVHLPHVRPGVGPHVRVLEHRRVRVARVVADETLAARAALDQRDVGRLGVPRSVMEPVARRVAAEDARARREQVERALRHHPQVLALVDGGGERRLHQPLRGAVDGQRVLGKGSQAEPADAVRIGSGVGRPRVGRPGIACIRGACVRHACIRMRRRVDRDIAGDRRRTRCQPASGRQARRPG